MQKRHNGWRLALAVGQSALALGLQAALIDHRVTVQPIVVCSTDGLECANPAAPVFEAETDKIWAQAGIDFRFLPALAYSNTVYLDVTSNPFAADSLLSLAGGAAHGQSPDPRVINLWFVKTIDGSPSVYGYSLQTTEAYGMIFPQNGACVADSAFAYAAGKGMRDIVAYEVARNLGLDNDTLGASADPLNLMKTRGPYPSGLEDIFPDGAGYGHLTPEQIAMARRTPFAVALPASEWYEYPPTPASDRDHDGMPDAWETAHGLDPDCGADATQDPDGDGMINQAEYLAGTDPGDPRSVLALAGATLEADGQDRNVRIRFTALAGKTYAVQCRDSFLGGVWRTSADVPPAAESRSVEVLDGARDGTSRYYRIVLQTAP